jgi:dTMP kinase
VICDRYLASTLVLQARDGIAASYLLALNEGIDLPDLAVILTAEPEIITARLDRRGRHDRFEHDPAAASTETAKSPRPSPGRSARTLERATSGLAQSRAL